MAFDAVLSFPVPSATGIKIEGESKIVENGIALTDQWGFSLENKLNITQHTSGAGAGKAEFDAFTIKKQVDKASHTLLLACGSGAHFNGVTLKIFKAGGNFINAKANLYICWTYNQLAVEKVEWAFGDPAPEETITFKFGACSIAYGTQDASGKITPAGIGSWNQIANKQDFMADILGGLQAVNIA
ncbi:type VI secretion system secreted protein Hcp [Arboricoccus pini]|uniref:Type VI secretion system secreted protein Hcp n=1 Tax=Arboricoccus pini TaxID=1963835 RepID=A0A212RQF9_9PROT|nr:type VI secretion system tube protein Hcp [Arboricoccus pini]SNB74777.1 type VI secretion system secreted protein Hcp [Arboricoccus pini]